MDRGEVAYYGRPDSYTSPHKSLDRNHTHFLCVDNGSSDENRYGGEVGYLFASREASSVLRALSLPFEKSLYISPLCMLV